MKRDEDALRRLLERGDPAADGLEPSPDDIARLRRHVLLAAETPARRVRGVAWVMVAAALCAVAVLGPRLARRAAPLPDPATTVTQVRQIHFQTPGGTRLIWVLRPADRS